MKYSLFAILIIAICSAEDDSLNFMYSDTSNYLKIKETNLSASLSEMNDTSGYRVNKKNTDTTSVQSYQIINKTMIKYLPNITYEYNKRLKQVEMENKNSRIKKNLRGKFVAEIHIGPKGNVVFCDTKESTLNDSLLELSILLRLYKMKFELTLNKNDTVKINYPFVFSK